LRRPGPHVELLVFVYANKRWVVFVNAHRSLTLPRDHSETKMKKKKKNKYLRWWLYRYGREPQRTGVDADSKRLLVGTEDKDRRVDFAK